MHASLIADATASTGTAAGPMWTDVLTAVGTVVAGFAATVGLFIAIRSGNRERAEAARERKAAAAQLKRQAQEADARLTRELNAAQGQFQQERAAADARFERERAADLDRRVEQRRIEAAASLLRRVADVMVRVDTLWGARLLASRAQGAVTMRMVDEAGAEACLEAVEALRRGAYTDARLIGEQELAERYRALLRLVLAVTHGALDRDVVNQRSWKDRTVDDLRNYGKVVMISLQRFIDGEPLPKLGHGVTYPMLTRNVNDNVRWMPSDFTDIPEWDGESDLDPADPQFRPTS